MSGPAAAGPVAPGEVIGAKYRLDSVIGAGGMGQVWKAHHVELGQPVAIKLVTRSLGEDADGKVRFRREAMAAARIESRHVARVFDHGELPDGTPFLVMEYLRGETLADLLDRRGSLPLLDAVTYVAQVCRGLARAHELGIVHRDVKPENVFLTHSPDDDGIIAKLVDFGIAKFTAVDEAVDSPTRTGQFVGTPLFMGPEQVRGLKTVDHRADLYSVGALAYTLLTGRHVFEGEGLGDLVFRICADPLPRLADTLPGVPPAVEAWFQRACARDPAQRFQSAREMNAALLEAAGLNPRAESSLSSVSLVQHMLPLRAEAASAAPSNLDERLAALSFDRTLESSGQGMSRTRSQPVAAPDTPGPRRARLAVFAGGFVALCLGGWYLGARSSAAPVAAVPPGVAPPLSAAARAPLEGLATASAPAPVVSLVASASAAPGVAPGGSAPDQPPAALGGALAPTAAPPARPAAPPRVAPRPAARPTSNVLDDRM